MVPSAFALVQFKLLSQWCLIDISSGQSHFWMDPSNFPIIKSRLGSPFLMSHHAFSVIDHCCLLITSHVSGGGGSGIDPWSWKELCVKIVAKRESVDVKPIFGKVGWRRKEERETGIQVVTKASLWPKKCEKIKELKPTSYTVQSETDWLTAFKNRKSF